MYSSTSLLTLVWVPTSQTVLAWEPWYAEDRGTQAVNRLDCTVRLSHKKKQASKQTKRQFLLSDDFLQLEQNLMVSYCVKIWNLKDFAVACVPHQNHTFFSFLNKTSQHTKVRIRTGSGRECWQMVIWWRFLPTIGTGSLILVWVNFKQHASLQLTWALSHSLSYIYSGLSSNS